MAASVHPTNTSVMYYLNTAFEYEIRNKLDIDIRVLQELIAPTDEDRSLLDRLLIVREYLDVRRTELKA